MSEEKKEFTKGDYTPVPIGDYFIRMNRIEEKKTRKGGTMLSAGFEIIKGDHKGRLVFHNFNIINANPKAVEIAEEHLDKYLKAIGEDEGKNILNGDYAILDDYLEVPFIATVGIEEAKEYTNKDGNLVMGKARNKILGFKKR